MVYLLLLDFQVVSFAFFLPSQKYVQATHIAVHAVTPLNVLDLWNDVNALPPARYREDGTDVMVQPACSIDSMRCFASAVQPRSKADGFAFALTIYSPTWTPGKSWP
jgi:hypothetical protein